MVNAEIYPEKSDFILATFDPQSGHEQKERRPALVISKSLFNESTGLRSEDLIISESLAQDFCSSSRRRNGRIASYATVSTTQKTDKKTSQDSDIIKSSLLTIICPITNTNCNIPFHIKVSEKSSFMGFIMAEQVNSIDYISRRVKFIEKADDKILYEVLSVLEACIYQNA